MMWCHYLKLWLTYADKWPTLAKGLDFFMLGYILSPACCFYSLWISEYWNSDDNDACLQHWDLLQVVQHIPPV